MNNINPIIKTDYPDPDVIRVDDTYYMISTTMYYMPGGVILRSYDLVNWEIVTYVFDVLDGSDEEKLTGDMTNYGKGMWAPTMRYHNGKFYVAFVSHGREDTHLFVADEITGPWEHRYINEYFHDCSLLFDDDGRIYIVSGNTEIRLAELNEDLSAVKTDGIDKIIVRDNREAVNLGYEGAHLYKINGKYVLTLIHWPKYNSRRTEAVFVSDSIDGEYIGGDVMWDDMGYHNMGVAQGGLVDTPEGKWYAILFQDSGAVGRVPVLVPVWCEEVGGTLVWRYGDNGIIPVNPEVKSTRPGYVYEPLYTSSLGRNSVDSQDRSSVDSRGCATDNANNELMPQWQWNHAPDNELWKLLPGDKLLIKTGKTSVNPVHAVNTLTQRMMLPTCSATVTIDGSKLNDGDMAGLIALEGCYGMIGLCREGDCYYIVRLVRTNVAKPYTIGYPDLEPGEVTDRIKVNESRITVRLCADFTDMNDKLVCMYIENNTEHTVGEPHQLKFGLDHFTGARFGLCVFSQKTVGGEAVFEDFSYEY